MACAEGRGISEPIADDFAPATMIECELVSLEALVLVWSPKDACRELGFR
jgi:hypothetical protein